MPAIQDVTALAPDFSFHTLLYNSFGAYRYWEAENMIIKKTCWQYRFVHYYTSEFSSLIAIACACQEVLDSLLL